MRTLIIEGFLDPNTQEAFFFQPYQDIREEFGTVEELVEMTFDDIIYEAQDGADFSTYEQAKFEEHVTRDFDRVRSGKTKKNTEYFKAVFEFNEETYLAKELSPKVIEAAYYFLDLPVTTKL